MKESSVVIIIMLSLLFVGCGAQEAPTQQPETQPAVVAAEEPIKEIHPLASELPLQKRDFTIGVAGFAPKNFPESDAHDWQTFFVELPKRAEIFGDYTAWDEEPVDGMPKQVKVAADITKREGMQLLVGLGFEPKTMEVSEAEAYFDNYGTEFMKTVENVAITYKPEYIALGVEVNRFWEKSAEGFEKFLPIYFETYDIVKSVSPDTKVFPIFQLENMKGAARLSGRYHEEHFHLIDKFEGKFDVLAFTSYPYLEYETPEQIPGDYYSSLAELSDKPIAFTEMGWPTGSNVIEGDEDMQVDFLNRFLVLTNPLELEMIVWTFLHDVRLDGPEAEAFDSIALKNRDGSEKKITEYWMALKSI